MKRLLTGTVIFAVILLLSGCFLFEVNNDDPYNRGDLVSQSEDVLLLEVSQVAGLLDDYL